MLFDSDETKEKILLEFLKICPFDGWSKDALLKAVVNCGIEEKFCDLIFEKSCLDLANFYIDYYNQKAALEILKIDDFSNKKVRDKIRLALYARFNVEKENKLALQRLVGFYLNPKNFVSTELGVRPIFHALKASYIVADFIWKAIDDQSTDFNFYTKRLTLSKIILRSVQRFMEDESHDFTQTKNFIDSEIEKVLKFQRLKMQAKEHLNDLFFDDEGELKSPKKIIKDLPFIRLIKF